LAPNTFTFLPLHRFTGRDISSGLLESKKLTQPMVIASVYMDSLIPQVPDLLLDLINYCKKEQLPLLFGADTNSWSSFWSSQEENKRGEMIEKLVITECLEIYNIGNSPTFRRPLGPHGNIVEKIIDVTFGMNIKDKVQIWRVAKSMLSDHLPIMFKIGKGTNTKTTVLSYKRADWELFQNKAGAYNTLDASGPWTQGCIKRELTSFYTDLNNIMTLTIPKVNINRRDNLDWWTPELEDSKAHVKKLENQYFNRKYPGPDLKREILQDARYNYRTLIKHEKSMAFRKLVNKTNSTSAMAKLSKILTKKNLDERLGLLTKPDGSTCKSTAENLQVLLAEHFPGSQKIRKKGLPKEFPTFPVHNEWINKTRLRDALKQFGEHKTAGPDGLKPLVLQHLPDKSLDKLIPIMNASLSLGCTPAIWQKSDVVFISRPAKKRLRGP
jgi:hypothetical protein